MQSEARPNGANTALGLLLRGLVFLVPLFFLPFTSDFFNLNKLAILAVGAGLSVLLWGFSVLRHRHFSYRVSPFDLGVLLFVAATILSTYFATQNKLDAFVFPGMATVILASSVIYFVLVQYLGSADASGSGPLRQGSSEASETKGKVSGIVSAWVWGVIAAAGVSLLSGVGLFSLLDKVVSLPAWIKAPYFSTVGGVVPSVLLFIVSAPLLFGRVMQAMGRAERSGGLTASTAAYFAGFIVFVAGLAFGVYNALPGKIGEFRNLPISSGWSIALETAKRQPFVGVGIGDFSEAFSRFRPVEYNMTSFWNLGFGSSTNWYLDLFTTSGLFGFLAFMFLILAVRSVFSKLPKGSRDVPYIKASFIAFLLVFLFAPANLTLLFSFFVLLGLLGAMLSRSVSLHFSVLGESVETGVPAGINLAALGICILGLLLLGIVFVFGGKVYAADVSYRKALNSVASQGKYKDVMDNLALAITKNPYADFYRTDYAQVALALMQEIARKEELTDADRNDVSQLIQLAIAQGKAGVTLNPTKSSNWASLAQIYRTIMPVVQGADEFTVSVYQQAISLEPTNPNLRIALGGVFYSLKNYDEATRAFELAVAAKPDLANAHYNLAIALREAGKIERAALELQQTLALVEPNSKGYDAVKQALDPLQAQLDQKAREATASAVTRGVGEQAPLQAPQPVPTSGVDPKLTLPSESAPPASGSANTQ